MIEFTVRMGSSRLGVSLTSDMIAPVVFQDVVTMVGEHACARCFLWFAQNVATRQHVARFWNSPLLVQAQVSAYR